MNMLPAVAVATFAISGGVAATYAFDDAAITFRLAEGIPIGLTALGFIGLIVSAVVGLTPVAIIVSTLLSASPLALFVRREYRCRALTDLQAAGAALNSLLRRPARRDWVNCSFCVFFFVVLWLVFSHAMVERADGIYTTLDNYGDLPFHLSIISRFLYGNNLPPEDPIYAGARFTYPFLADFVAAVFAKAGADIRHAMLLENLLLAVAFVGLLYRFGLELTRDRLAALLTPAIVLFNGGMGWYLLFSDARGMEKGLLSLLGDLPHNYTVISNTGWRFGNVLTSLLLTQRSILLGLPLALVILTQLWVTIACRSNNSGHGANGSRPARMAAAGIATGMLPLVHSHSFLVVIFVVALLAVLFRAHRSWTLWAAFFIPAVFLAMPQVWWVAHGTAVSTHTFFGLQLGWDRGSDGIVWFWFKNAGPFIVLTGIALAIRQWNDSKPNDDFAAVPTQTTGSRCSIVLTLRKGEEENLAPQSIQLARFALPTFLQSNSSFQRFRARVMPRNLLVFYLPFLLCFLIPNVVRLAPWIWDNIKVIVYWYIASAPIVCVLLAHLWRGRKAMRVVAVSLFLLLTAAGGLETWRVMSGASSFRDFDLTDIEFAKMIRESTPSNATILHAAIHNDPVFLSGRRSLLGAANHVWSHGIQADQRESDMKRIYAGSGPVQALARQYGVDYAVIGLVEKEQTKIDSALFLAYFEKVGEVKQYSLYKYKFKGSRQIGAEVAVSRDPN